MISIPPCVSSIPDLTPAIFVSIATQSLRYIDGTLSFPPSLLEFSMADRYKICTDMASSVKNLGYIGDISFHEFLYPSEEDKYKLVRFFVRRLSESSEAEKSFAKKDIDPSGIVEEESFKSTTKELTEKVENEMVHSQGEDIIIRLKDLQLKAEVKKFLGTKPKDALVTVPGEPDSFQETLEGVTAVHIYRSGVDSTEDCEDSRNTASDNGEAIPQGESFHVFKFEHKPTSPEEDSFEMRHAIEQLKNQEKTPMEDMSRKLSQVQNLEEEQELLKVAAEMASDEELEHQVDFYIIQRSKQADARLHNLVGLDSQRNAVRKPLEEKNKSFQEVLYATKPDSQERLQNLKEIELEMQAVLSETKKREEELLKLSTDFEQQSVLASTRRSYIERIKEITKNRRKQDIDIERILKETRELQLESNSVQECLHRTYAVVDGTLFREAKKDSVVHQAYRLLTSIHESFEQISEKILATDRTRREEVDHEAKLAAMSSQILNTDKLQADLDAIRMENEFLQQHIHNSLN